MKFIHIYLTLFLLLFSTCSLHAADHKRKLYSIHGVVTTLPDREPASFAVVKIDQLNAGTVCDIDGHYELNKIPEGEYTIHFRSLGYNLVERRIKVSGDTVISVKLSSTSFALPELEVMASQKKHDKIVVNEAAIEYIQPTSLADVLLLLPGNIYKENKMSSFGQISSRQVGSDANTSLGMAVMTDGAPVTDDGMRTQMIGITANSGGRGDSEVQSRTGMNQGTDMRYLSTDHIQSVEFTRGISSARYGNLSSGMIQVKSKYGVTPLRIRVKSDLKNKLAYVGKGFKLSDRAGSLHIGADFLHAIDDVREEMDKFSRFTAQAYYKNQFKWGRNRLDFDAKLSQTLSVDKMKTDVLTQEYDEKYKSDYSKTALMLKGEWTTGHSWLDKLELMLSSDVVFSKIDRHKMVLSGSGPLSVPLAKEEGEHEGMYLPGKYYSDFYLANIPINLFVQADASSRFQLSKPLGLHLEYGLDYRRTKNRGDGAVIADEMRPPYPYDNSYMRPRPNWQIPALSTGAAYLQADLLYTFSENNYLKLSAGGRVTKMFNLPSDYYLSHHALLEPRVNASYTVGKKVKHTFRVGYGWENKLPTMDYLYPEKVYKDFYMMNAYNDNPEYRRLITYTDIYDVTNKDIRANRGEKLELGWDLVYKDFDFSVTAFYEASDHGFEYYSYYKPLTYDLYSQVRPGVDITTHVPQKEDYIMERYSTFTDISQVRNSRKTIKRGLEYRIIFPRIEPLCTTVELNGAYYRTNYGSSIDEYYYPAKRTAGKPYPYVGIYRNDPQYEYRRVNTNFWFNTHIPKFRLIFTNFIQVVWMSTDQYKDLHVQYPHTYMDFEGNMHPVGQAERDRMDSKDYIFHAMKRMVMPIDYACNRKPVSLLWNIKVTKEFKKYAKLSFFANNLLDIHPKYTTGGQVTDRDWVDPYFGVELFLNFNL